MNLEEVEVQISEMFTNIPIIMLNALEGFIVILHGSEGCAINISTDLLDISLEHKKIIIVSLLKKLVDNPTELLNLLNYEGL